MNGDTTWMNYLVNLLNGEGKQQENEFNLIVFTILFENNTETEEMSELA